MESLQEKVEVLHLEEMTSEVKARIFKEWPEQGFDIDRFEYVHIHNRPFYFSRAYIEEHTLAEIGNALAVMVIDYGGEPESESAKIIRLEIARLEVKPGEMLVLRCPRMTDAQYENFIPPLERALPHGVTVILLTPDTELLVVSPQGDAQKFTEAEIAAAVESLDKPQ